MSARAVAVAAGGFHSLALRSDGTVVAWGLNDRGQCDVPTGLTDVAAIAAGDRYNLALTRFGTVVGWGSWGEPGEQVPLEVPPGLAEVSAVAAGSRHSLALRRDGTVLAWGTNDDGQCDVPPGLTSVVRIAAGSRHSMALKRDGTVVAWGDWIFSNESISDRLSRVELPSIRDISAYGNITLFLTGAASVIAWDNHNPNLWRRNGQRDTGAFEPEAFAGRPISAIAAGGNHLAISGGAVIMARHFFDPLPTPTGLRDAVSVAPGGYHFLALRSGGSVVAWGDGKNAETDVPTELKGW